VTGPHAAHSGGAHSKPTGNCAKPINDGARQLKAKGVTNDTNPQGRPAVVDADEQTWARRLLISIAILAILVAAAWVWRFHVQLALG
jgi:hypothetical protein